jgi:hypothetical protein
VARLGVVPSKTQPAEQELKKWKTGNQEFRVSLNPKEEMATEDTEAHRGQKNPKDLREDNEGHCPGPL